MRGFGQPQVTLAMESLMDELARRLEIDPLELRLRNAWRLGSETATGQVLKESVSLVETLEKARAVTEWDEKRKLCKEDSCGSVRKGIGLACMGYGVSLGAKGWPIDRSGAHVQIWPDGSVSIGIGVIDMGQGTFTVISQIAAEGLQVSPDLIRINEVSTQVVPDSGPTVASRATVMGGNAVLDAISELKRRLSERAAVKLGVHVDDVVCGMESYEAGGKRISYRDLVKDCFLHNINLAAMGWYNAPHLEWDHEVFQGDAYFIYSFATHVAEVEVDEETGQVTVTKVTAVHDTGRTINPQLVEGQVEGGVVQGMGWAVCEDLKYRDGIPLTGSFSTYTIPTSLDSPTIETHLLENPYSAGPFGAKGIGEPCLIPQAPAVTNAISHALGIWVKDIPATPERIKEYMIRRDDGRS
jgi:CO/xanthine dehydrogenase Mo-binding subunit